MGRKKIEIKPLTDERNRNVTFLKRKAGLMKKAYELSVLCGVTVSLLIFSNNGKPYEFSSGDFDTEVDRYNEYEGMIERRRAAEFEALAAAGDDSDDDDEGRSAAGGAAGKKAAGPTKSLKGKETFKARRVSRGGAQDDRRGGRGSFAEGDHSFVTGLLDDERANGDQMPQRPDSPTSAGLSYALGLHSQQGSAPSGGWNSYRSGGFQLPFPQPGAPYLPTAPGGALSLEANVPWGNQMITTYAWLQIQQAHQEQKRQLLEKQQQQLLELTSRSGGAFFRDILGGGGGGSGSGSGGASQSTSNSSWNEFVWPTAPAGAGDELPPAGPPPGPGPGLGGSGGGMSTPPDDDLVWALSGGHAHHSAQHAHPQQHMQQQQQGYFGEYPQGIDVLTPASLVDRKRTRDSDIRDLRHPDMHKRRK